MTKKRKKVMRLEDNQAAIAGELEDWQHIIMVYQSMGHEDPTNAEYWFGMAEWLERDLNLDLQEREEWLNFELEE